MAQDKIFADGFIFKKNPKSPEWVIGSISVKVGDAVAFLERYADNGWVNLQLKEAKGGKLYVELDTWKPNKEAAPSDPAPAQADTQDELPF